MGRRLILFCLAGLGATAPVTLHAQETSAAACAAFNQVEAEGRGQVDRRIAEIDAAAAAGDIARFCRASSDLVFVYNSLQAAAASCSTERAARWGQAAQESRTTLAKTCP